MNDREKRRRRVGRMTERNVYRERAVYKRIAELLAAAIDRVAQKHPRVLADDEYARTLVSGALDALYRLDKKPRIAQKKGRRTP